MSPIPEPPSSYTVTDGPYWDGPDLVFTTEQTGEVRLANAILTNFSFVGLETEAKDDIIIVGNSKAWDEPPTILAER